MWYRGDPNRDEIRTAKPLGWGFGRKKKRKTKNFGTEDAPIFPEPLPTPENLGSPQPFEPKIPQNIQNQPINALPKEHGAPHDFEPKTPQNVVETPDLPAGVKMHPKMPEPHDIPPHPKHPIPEKEETPDELKKLYGPDHNMKDDHIVNKPQNQKDLEEIEHPDDNLIEPDQDLEPNPDEEPQTVEPEPPETTPQPVPNPPIHNLCHCEIITLPGGRRVWRANSGACDQCLDARDKFNQWQSSQFGV